MKEKESWHLNKGVPVSIIVVLILEFAGFVWIASNMESRITYNTDEIDELKVEVDRHGLKQHDVDVKLGRIETEIGHISNTVQAISRKLDAE